jgi:hypothetical protein
MRNLPARRAALALGLAGTLAGCGYYLSGQGAGVLPPHVKTLVVVPFENRTTRPEIEQRVTEQLSRELSRRRNYDVVTDRSRADAALEGAVTTYRAVPVVFNEKGLATRVEAVVTIAATVRDLATDEVLWGQDGLVFREQFEVPETEDFQDLESSALDDIARGAAGAVVTAIVEGF